MCRHCVSLDMAGYGALDNPRQVLIVVFNVTLDPHQEMSVTRHILRSMVSVPVQ